MARSSRENGSEADVVDEIRRDLARRTPHVWLPAPAGRRSTLDVLGDGLTLFAGPGGAWRAAARALSGDEQAASALSAAVGAASASPVLAAA